MERNSIRGIIERKTFFDRSKIEKISLNSGKIDFNYFKSIIQEIAEKCKRMGFRANSSEWVCVKRRLKSSDLIIANFIDLFDGSPQENAHARAKIMKPPISPALVRQYVADCIGIDVADLKEQSKISVLVIKACPLDYSSYLTIADWCEEMFHKKAPLELLEKGTLKDLIDFYVDE